MELRIIYFAFIIFSFLNVVSAFNRHLSTMFRSNVFQLKETVPNKVNRNIAISAISFKSAFAGAFISLIISTQSHVAFAESLEDLTVGYGKEASISIYDADEVERQRIERKLQKQRQISDVNSDDENGTYASSLKREKAKQDEISKKSKSKSARSKDLCEVLGRGC
jgi:hypothetical protein